MLGHVEHEAVSQNRPAPAPLEMLSSLVGELEQLRLQVPAWDESDLVELHAALLLFGLDGRADLLPIPSFGLSLHNRLERRVARRARELARRVGDDSARIEFAADVIERHVHLIDPDLATCVA